MDYKFLDKVVDQIVRETIIDYGEEIIVSPFHPFTLSHPPFSDHCRDVYGLNNKETEYVWKEYKQAIKDKVNNGL
jgi:hypothetical protein